MSILSRANRLRNPEKCFTTEGGENIDIRGCSALLWRFFAKEGGDFDLYPREQNFKINVFALSPQKRDDKGGVPGGRGRPPLHGLSFHELPEHLFRINRNEHAPAARQHFPLLIHDFCHIDVLASMHRDFPSLRPQGLLQRHGLQILHRHFFRECNDVAEFVYFPHGVIENASDHASMAVPGRPGIAFREPKAADERLTFVVEGEFQAHALGIVRTADETVVFLQFVLRGFVTVDLAWHGKD